MSLIKFCKKGIEGFVKIGYSCISRCIPVDQKTVMFISFHGKGYSDSPKAIYEEMRSEKPYQDWKYVWVIKNAKNKQLKIEGAEIVEYLSVKYFLYLARAKYWVFNCKMPAYISKKKNQTYLQTWHGTPLKRLGYDIVVPEDTTFYRSGMSYEEMTKSYEVDSARYDYMISPNTFSTKVFQSAFHVDEHKMIETGYPRNDFIVNATKEDCDRIKEKYGIPQDKKVVLYAPTWRDNSFNAKGYVFELKADFYRWKAVLGEEYVLVFKPHYLIINRYAENEDLKGFLYQIPAEVDINEIYVISDILVTDYSSVFFDYAVLNRPIYFYMYDLEEYKDEIRGFYLDIYKDLPGKIYEREEELLQSIRNQEYDLPVLKEFNKRFNEFHKGDSAKQVVDILVNGNRR